MTMETLQASRIRTVHVTAHRLGALARSVPVALATGLASAVAVALSVATAHPHQPPSGVIAAAGITALLASLGGVGWAERLMGHRRVFLAVLVAVGSALALHSTLSASDIALHLYEARRGGAEPLLGPTIPAVGAVAAASASMHPLTRRRVRLIGATVLLMLVLYAGQGSDITQAVVAVIGLALGMLLERENPLHRRPATRRETRGLLAAVVAITALGPIVTAIAPSSHGLLDPLGQLFFEPVHDFGELSVGCSRALPIRECAMALSVARLDGPGPILLSLMPLVLLLLAARGIAAGRWIAVWLAVGVNLVTSVVGATYFGLLPLLARPETSAFQIEAAGHFRVFLSVSILFPLAVDIVLIASLRMFPRDIDQRSALTFVGLALTLLAATIVVVLGVGWLARDQFSPLPGPGTLLLDLPELLFPAASLGFQPRSFTVIGPAAAILTGWIGPVFWTLLIGLAWAAVRRIGVRRLETGPQRARELARAGRGGAISWMTTWAGNDYWTSSDGSLVAYRVVGNVAISTGEPLASDGRPSEAVLEFASFCLDHGWTPVLYSVGDQLKVAMTRAGWTALRVGEETVIDVEQFSLSGKRMNSVRTAINRAERDRTTAVWTAWNELPAVQVAQIIDLSESWAAEKALPELGFTLGGLDELADPEVRLMLAVNAAGRVEAVTSWMPTYEGGTVSRWTLDFMRERGDSANGTMEFVISAVILRAKQFGPPSVSLSGAPLVSADQTPAESRVTDIIAQSLEPLYGFRSLLRFKLKFQPSFERMWLLTPSAVALPAVGVALARAYLPTLSGRGALRLLASARRQQ